MMGSSRLLMHCLWPDNFLLQGFERMSAHFAGAGYDQAATMFIPYVSAWLPLEVEAIFNYSHYNNGENLDGQALNQTMDTIAKQYIIPALGYCDAARTAALKTRLNQVQALCLCIITCWPGESLMQASSCQAGPRPLRALLPAGYPPAARHVFRQGARCKKSCC